MKLISRDESPSIDTFNETFMRNLLAKRQRRYSLVSVSWPKPWPGAAV